MDRRRFLQLFGGGVVASATMAEASFLADFMAWLKRKPVWSIPVAPKLVTIQSYTEFASISDLSTLAATYYDKKALDALKDNLLRYLAHQPRPKSFVCRIP